MPSNAETIFLPIADGLDTSRDARAGVSVLAAENLVYARKDVLAKREGTEQTDTAYSTTAPTRLATNRGGAVLWGAGRFGVVDVDTWSEKQIEPETPRLAPTLHIEGTQIGTTARADDIAIGETFIAVSAVGGVLRIYRQGSLTLLSENTYGANASDTAPPGKPMKLVALGDGRVACYYLQKSGGIDGTALAARIIATDGTVGAETELTDITPKKDGSGRIIFDACCVPNSGAPIVVLFCKNSADQMTAAFLPNGLPDGTYKETVAMFGGPFQQQCACYVRSNTLVEFVWVEGGPAYDVVARAYSAPSKSGSISKQTIYSYGSGTYNGNAPRSITGVGGTGTSSDGYTFLLLTFDVGTAAGCEPMVLTAHIYGIEGGVYSKVGGLTIRRVMAITKPVRLPAIESANETLYAFGVLSRAFMLGAGTGTQADNDAITGQDTVVWMFAGYESDTPEDYDTIPIGKSAASTAYFDPYGFTPGVSNLVLDGTDILSVQSAVVSSGLDAIQGYSYVTNIARETYANTLYRLTLGAGDGVTLEDEGVTLLAGSLPLQFDGAAVFEQGFVSFPEPLAVTLNSTGNPSGLAAGTYLYKASYEHVDAAGRLHRSDATLGNYSITISAGQAPAWVDIRVPCLTLSQRQTDKVQIVVWRTQDGDAETYLRLGFVANDRSAQAVTFTDTAEDASIADNEPLHTGGGQVRPTPPAGHSAMAIWDQRLFLADEERPRSRLTYSRQRLPYVAWEHAPELALELDERGGNIVALAPLGEALFVLKESAIYAIDGEGLDALAQGKNYQVRLVSSGIGCRSPRTVAETPVGLLFDAGSALHRLAPDGELSALDAPRAYYEQYPPLEAVVQPSRHRVVFLGAGAALVFDWRFSRWTHFTEHESVAGADIEGTLHGLTSTFTLRRGTSGTSDGYGEGLQWITSRVRLGWVYPGGIVGGRGIVKEASPVMYHRGAHVLTVRCAYDGSPYFGPADTLDFDAAEQPESFSEQEHHGAGWESLEAQAYTVRYQPRRRQCASFCLELEDGEGVIDEAPAGTSAGFELVGMALTVAKAPGPEQLDRTRHVKG